MKMTYLLSDVLTDGIREYLKDVRAEFQKVLEMEVATEYL